MIVKILGTACVTTYYCSLIALSIYYLVVSCYPVLPWTVCHDHLQASKNIQNSDKTHQYLSLIGRVVGT